ncbi:patj homolog [Condylostylus longicornis]|uniref:patj homolog n=1 Tax=Condylostylus longicornis TaxID=2530218 RepID=UPI00244E1E3F|nr:patj homolog [Condylostylus longicornis]
MHLSSNISSALQHIEAVKKAIDECDDPKLQMATAESLKTMLDVLECPVFRTLVQIQDSLCELNRQLVQHPSMLPNDFDIDISGNLILKVPQSVDLFEPEYPDEQRVSSAQMSPRSLNSPLAPCGYLQDTKLDDQAPFIKKARGYNDLSRNTEEERPQSVVSNSSRHASDLFSTEWTQIQAIELVNDGTGLGFGIIGARTAGVTVKTILPGGVADRDGRLRSGDHILQIGSVNLHDMVSEQVASVLRQSGTHVRLVVARPVEQILPKYELELNCAIVPSRVVLDPNELERYLIAAGYPDIFGENSTPSTPQEGCEVRFSYNDKDMTKRPPMAVPIDLDDIALPETQKFEVELTKDVNGLGITIAGYVCEKEELSGIFVKSVSPGSAADLSGKIRVNDRIIEVDGKSLQGFSNHQAVDVLKKSGQVVILRLERYLRGPKYEQLQQAIAANEIKLPSLPATPSRLPLAIPQRRSSIGSKIQSSEDQDSSETISIGHTMSMERKKNIAKKSIDDELNLHDKGKKLVNTRDSLEQPIKGTVDTCLDFKSDSFDRENKELVHSAKNQALIAKHKYYVDPDLTPEMEIGIIRKWKQIVGMDVKIIVAQIKKFAVSSGLGISLEGTVDVEGGREVRPHHYIRSILPEGPVGQNGLLKSGDELLEVNGQRLLGMNHLEVVAILKELPQDVRMVVGRGRSELSSLSMDKNATPVSSVLETKKQNLDLFNATHNLLPASERLVKAKSDGSLATAGNGTDEAFSKLKSRSLEPLTGLAMWSSEPQIIELVKGERGLGFSILDYQDPLDPNDTLIVIRSLVPGGVAQLDGRLIPGDRLLFVNNINLENASLDQAVQALKGAPKGIVRIGVAKPLPMTDNSVKSHNGNNTENNINTMPVLNVGQHIRNDLTAD